MKLLAPPPLTEVPAETLLARLRSRRAAIDSTGSATDAAAPPVTLTWLLPRLNGRLRRALRPYLEVVAMRPLTLALRHRLAGVAPPDALLNQPWLNPGLPSLVAAAGEAATVVARVERALAADYPFVRGLTVAFHHQGPGMVETRLTSGMLEQSLVAAREPTVVMALRCFIDLRNLLAVLRHWRWQLHQPPPLLSGGEINKRLLANVCVNRDQAAFVRLAARLSPGGPLELDPRTAERRLQTGLGQRLRRAGRDPLGAGVVLDTLWRSEIAKRDRTLHHGAGDSGDDLLSEVLL